jgi:hypothetical protein
MPSASGSAGVRQLTHTDADVPGQGSREPDYRPVDAVAIEKLIVRLMAL